MNQQLFFFLIFLAVGSGPVMTQPAEPATEPTVEPTVEEQAIIKALAQEVEAACATPAAPIVPNGATATREEMLAAQQALKTYVETGNDYLGCLEALESEWGEDITTNQAAVITALYNRVVESMQTRADAFNAALGVYQAQDAG